MRTLNVLCVGDIVGSVGRGVLKDHLAAIQHQHNIHFTIANLENSAGGFGFTDKIYKELRTYPIQAFTAGNHLYDKKEIIKTFENYTMLVRPLNLPPGNPGVGWRIFNVNNFRIAVVNLIGRVFMGQSDCPFQTMQKYLPQIKEQADVIVVDMHAEASSEKEAMGWFLDGQATAVFGTHTHVMTADDRLLPQGTAYITDIGFVGTLDSVLGMDKNIVLERFLTQIPIRFESAKTGQKLFNGIKIEVDLATKQAVAITRLQYTY